RFDCAARDRCAQCDRPFPRSPRAQAEAPARRACALAARAHAILPGQSDSRVRARQVRAPSGYDANVIEVPGFRILRQLGRGGMATVYLAMQESVDREVALKVMSPALLVDPDFGERF